MVTAGRRPRMKRILALAVRFEGQLQDGTVRDYAELARLGGVSRARITQIMSLRNLARVIPGANPGAACRVVARQVLNERLLRGMAQRCDWREQVRMWELEDDQRKSARNGRTDSGINASSGAASALIHTGIGQKGSR